MRNKKDNEINKTELNDVIILSKKVLKVLYIIFIGLFLLAVIIACQRLNVFKFILDFLSVISPLFIGFIIAWLLRPIVLKLNTKTNNNALSSILVFGGFVLILVTIIYTFVPTIYTEINELVGILPSFVERITLSVNDIFINFEGTGLADFKNNLLLNITNYSIGLAEGLPKAVINIVVSLFSGIGTFVMGAVIGIYMLIDYDNIGNYFQKLFPKQIRKDVNTISNRMGTEARKCVNGTLLVALMVMVCDSIGFTLVGLNAPLLFGVICGVTDLIPYIGPYIGGAAAVIMGLTQDPLIGIGTLIIVIIIQIVESYILQPIVMSRASSLHPIIIIIALLVFGHFFGVLGMILATPLLTIARVLVEFILEKVKSK